MLLDETLMGKKRAHNLAAILGIRKNLSPNDLCRLPFTPDDTTAGSESELQVAVAGDAWSVDLPLSIRTSCFYENEMRRAASGDTSGRTLQALDRYLDSGLDGVWENSWVRFPLDRLNAYARSVLENDLLADKANPDLGRRTDCADFLIQHGGEAWLRVPISYLLKLSLADLAGSLSEPAASHAKAFLKHFLNDNTSPETFSFYPSPTNGSFQGGKGVARETSQRFLLTQLLLDHANTKFGLKENGQTAVAYFAPLPPARQKRLNELIPDAHYRELFVNPCLSGWDRGEEKKTYMGLCHRILSRSQLNTVAKLRDAGLLSRNLVVLPNTSNTCLANNGTHVSLGSRRLGEILSNPFSRMGPDGEKYFGDLAIKIMEHFLPLFVGTCSAAPMRMDFEDFHPEKALGFLPHELDYTHLRMLWRRWKKKARLRFLGNPLTPFGPPLLDRALARVLALKGDFVPDFRLLDYMTTLMSTHRRPALSGVPGNDVLLKRELQALGIFHESMSTYLLCKQRIHSVMGFSGFEGRFYSLFDSLNEDMRLAVDIQQFLSCLAYKLMAAGEIRHEDIPDTPKVESERRQIFFATAISVPTFFVRKNSQNRFLHSLLRKTTKTRSSKRYPGNFRVHVQEYRLVLLDFMEGNCPDLVDMFGIRESLIRLRARIKDPQLGAEGKLTRRILNHAGVRSPFSLRGREFNMAAEEVYRNELRRDYLLEALDYVAEDCTDLARLLPHIVTDADIPALIQTGRDALRRTGELTPCGPALTSLLLTIIGIHGQEACA